MILASYAIASLPREVQDSLIVALSPQGTLEQAHVAAQQIVTSASAHSMANIIGALIFMANDHMSVGGQEVSHG